VPFVAAQPPTPELTQPVNDFAKVGVLSARMSLQGYGSQVPVDSNSTADGRAKNRRVEVVLSRIHTSSTDTESTP